MAETGLQKKQKTLYNAYIKKQDEYDKELAKLQQEKKAITDTFDKRRKSLKAAGGTQTKEIDAQIEDINKQLKAIDAEYNKKINDAWREFTNDEMFTGKKNKLISKKDAEKQPKSIGKKIIAVLSFSGIAAAGAKLLHKKATDNNYNEEFYLKNSSYPQEVVDGFKRTVEEAKNSSDPEVARQAASVDTEHLTTTNFLDTVTDMIQTNAEAVKSDPAKIEQLKQTLADFGYSTQDESINEIIDMYVNYSTASSKEMMFAKFNTAEIASITPDYTIPATLGTALLSSTLVFLPYIYASLKLRSWDKKYKTKKHKVELKEATLTKECEAKKQKLLKQKTDTTAKKDEAYQQEVYAGIVKINKEEDEACKLVDLKIKRVEALSDLNYNHYLKQLAQEGSDLAVAKDNPAKTIKIGKPYRYENEMQKISENITKLNKKIDALSTNNEPVLS